MSEFIYNCYLWVANNYKEITMVLTSTQFISIISAIALLVKSMKKTDANTDTAKALTKRLEQNDHDTIVAIENELKVVNAENVRLKNDVIKFKTETMEALDVVTAKINAMIEVQSVVYSTIKNDNIRDTVNGLLLNAKYAETQTRKKLKQEVEELKVKVAEKFDDVMGEVEKTVNVVNAAVSDTKDEDIVRY